ncbi:MAG: L-iditol 2-dehydrogenase, partial [Planctomycetes bacterium]|nr:L-iditol 2-dehydrogenase [Planctomycetota bacterium]
MKAAIIVAPRKIEIREVETPKPVDGQVLIRTRCAAICGSDHPFFQGIQTYRKPPLPPGHPGHETMGVVAESRTPDFSPGDAVIAIPKGDCGFAEYFVADAARACRLPQGHDG